MDRSRASSVYNTGLSLDNTSRKPTRLNNSNSQSSVRATSRPGSFKAARDYIESLGKAPSTGTPSRVPSARVASAPMQTTSHYAPSSSVSTMTSSTQSAHAPSSSVFTISYSTRPGASAGDESSSSVQRTEDYAASEASSIQATPTSSKASFRHSAKPSFMNYKRPDDAPPVPVSAPQPITRKPVGVANGMGIPAAPVGMILLFLAAEVPKEVIYYLEILLKKRNYSGIAVIGLHEQKTAIKQLKVDIYGLLGRLGKEMSVQTYLQAGWSPEQIAEVAEKAMKASDAVKGVLSTQSYGLPETEVMDILSLENDTLAQSWQKSFGYLHAIAKVTLPLLAPVDARSDDDLFLVIEAQNDSPAGTINKAACDVLMRQLSTAYRGLTVDYAKNVLMPEPEPTPKSKLNGTHSVHAPQRGYTYDEPALHPSESPTKLWTMWALQDQLGTADLSA